MKRNFYFIVFSSALIPMKEDNDGKINSKPENMVQNLSIQKGQPKQLNQVPFLNNQINIFSIHQCLQKNKQQLEIQTQEEIRERKIIELTGIQQRLKQEEIRQLKLQEEQERKLQEEEKKKNRKENQKKNKNEKNRKNYN